MILWLWDRVVGKWGDVKECELVKSNEIADSCKYLHLPTGELLAVTANELIQCLSYPELEMEKIFELSLEGGWYAIQNEDVDRIMYCRKNPDLIPSNIQEIRRKRR